MPTADATSLRAALLAVANSGGGWGYYPRARSRLEPTCWSLLAFGSANKGFDPEPHWRFLLSCQQPSGLLVEDTTWPINIGFNALAAFTLLADSRRAQDPALSRLLGALIKQSGLQVAQSPHFRQDNSLRGWSWIESTFSWIESTCWGILALKRAMTAGVGLSESAARIEEAERLLLDRVCRDGGWNYGNANALGKDLFPYVPVTALALLALQNRRETDAVTRSLRYLQAHWATESSTIGLALTSICLRYFALPTDKVDRALRGRLPIAANLNNVHAMAVALAAIDLTTNAAFAI